MQYRSCGNAVSLRFRGVCEVPLYMCVLAIIFFKMQKNHSNFKVILF